MKKIAPLLLLFSPFFSCKNKKSIPDVSGIEVSVPVVRFDKDFFSIDTNNIPAGLQKLQQQHLGFYIDFMQQILGVSGADTSFKTIAVTKELIRGYKSVFDSLQSSYNETGWLQKELEQSFRFVKYYFPKYKPGSAILFVGPFDAPGVALTQSGLAIGLQQYAGSNFSVYQSAPGQEMFPLYISRRFDKKYIVANCMKAVAQDLFPDNSGAKPLIEQMVERGKQWYLLDKFMPEAPDSIKTGYTQHQLEWCSQYEGMIWSHIVKNEDLNSLSPAVIQTYIGEGPFTQGMSQEDSPGNIGQWIGWQIVKKYAAKNSNLKPEEVMMTPAAKIIEEAKYKPK